MGLATLRSSNVNAWQSLGKRSLPTGIVFEFEGGIVISFCSVEVQVGEGENGRWKIC